MEGFRSRTLDEGSSEKNVSTFEKTSISGNSSTGAKLRSMLDLFFYCLSSSSNELNSDHLTLNHATELGVNLHQTV